MIFNLFRKKSMDSNTYSGERTRRGIFKNLSTSNKKTQKDSRIENRNQQKKNKNINIQTKTANTLQIPRTQVIDSDCGYESSTSTASRSYASQIDLQKERSNTNHEMNDGNDNNDNQDYGYRIPDYAYDNGNTNTSKSCKETDYGYGGASPDTRPQQHWNQQHQYNNNNDDLGYEIGYTRARAVTGTAPPLSSSSDHKTSRRSSLKNKGTPRRASIGYKGEMTLVLPNGEEKKRRTSISFVDDTKNQTKEVRPIHKMVDNNNRLWFQAEEYLHIRKEIYRVMRKSQLQPQSEHRNCTRGLENYNNSYAENARKIASSQVLEEYMLQKGRGEYDDETIRQMYTFHTIDCQVEAVERGQNDAKSIQTYMKKTRN